MGGGSILKKLREVWKKAATGGHGPGQESVPPKVGGETHKALRPVLGSHKSSLPFLTSVPGSSTCCPAWAALILS